MFRDGARRTARRRMRARARGLAAPVAGEPAAPGGSAPKGRAVVYSARSMRLCRCPAAGEGEGEGDGEGGACSLSGSWGAAGC